MTTAPVTSQEQVAARAPAAARVLAAAPTLAGASRPGVRRTVAVRPIAVAALPAAARRIREPEERRIPEQAAALLAAERAVLVGPAERTPWKPVDGLLDIRGLNWASATLT